MLANTALIMQPCFDMDSTSGADICDVGIVTGATAPTPTLTVPPVQPPLITVTVLDGAHCGVRLPFVGLDAILSELEWSAPHPDPSLMAILHGMLAMWRCADEGRVGAV